MTSVVPPPPTPPPQALQAPQLTVVVSNPPATLAQLQLGARLDATVLGQGGTGQVQVQTPQGVLTLQTVFPLPPNASVVLQLQSLAPRLLLQIAAINGKPPLQGLRGTSGAPSGAPAAAARGAAGTGTAAPGGSGLSAVNLAVGATLVATVLRTSSMAGPGFQSRVPSNVAAKTGSPMPEGVGQGTIQETSRAARRPASAGGGRGPTAPSPASSAAASGTPHGTRGAPGPGRTGPGAAVDGRAAGAATHGGLPAGTQVTIKVLSLQPSGQEAAGSPAAPSPAAVGLAKGTTQTATVAGRTTTGQPIVHMPAGTVALAARTTLPPGSTVTFEIIDTPTPPQARLRVDGPAPRQELLMSRDWQALKEAVAVLREAEPLIAQQFLNTVVPRPDAQLAANVLFFLAALRGGNVRAWLGDGPSRTLQRQKPDLLSRLGDEFRTIGRMADEPVSGDWRIAVVPFNSGEELQQIRFFMRRHGAEDDEDEEGGDPGTRFIVDVELSRLGRMQLDGLVRGGDKRLDLIVRSASSLPRHMRDDIQGIFQDACQLTGMTGAATFQCAPPNFIEISPESVMKATWG